MTEHDYLRINDVQVGASALVSILNLITDPDPRRWYNFRRQGDQIIVQVKIEESA